MALGTTALTTLATVNDELGLTSDSGDVDARIERYIMSASEAFASMCDRALHYAVDHVERVSAAGGVYLCVSDHTPIISISEILWDPRDGTTTTVDANDYAISDDGAGKIERVNGAWASTEVKTQSITRIGTGRTLPRYKITYTGGYVTPQQAADDVSLTRTLPYDIEDTVIQMVTTRYRSKGRDQSISSKKVGPASVSYTNAAAPDSVDRVAQKYKRRAFA